MELFYLMYMKKALLFFVLLLTNTMLAQYELIDAKMEEMPKANQNTIAGIAQYITQNFTSEPDRARAAFYWTASNINYDVEHMYQPKIQTREEKITDALKNKKGVCMHYAEVFNAIINQMGMQSYVVEGYTKQFGKIAALGHSWNVCKVEGKWCLFDATWGAGFVKDEVYYKKPNPLYYKPESADFLKTHMPFDYMWQLNNKPITNDDFYNDSTESTLISDYYDYNAEIEAYEKLTPTEKIQKQLDHITQAGLKNGYIKDQYNLLQRNMESLKNNSSIPKLQAIVTEFNEANRLLNDFIHYRNSRFTPMVSDDKIKEKIQVPYDKWLFCQQEIAKITDVSKENMANFIALKKTVASAQKRFDDQMQFVTKYLAMTPASRATAFMLKRN